MNVQPKELLSVFGLRDFRGSQESIIRRLIESEKGDHHCLVLMPTGAGKSLCYQLPALYFSGGTLVVSPLIALMQDQVNALCARGIEAQFINSSVQAPVRNRRLEAFLQNELKLLYVAPERFRKKEFAEKIARARISLLAVDEAHCISEWGHDFRPDYSRLGEFRELLGNPLTIALTATATPDVQQDIISALHLNPDRVEIFHQGIERPNLRLAARDVISEEEKLEAILNVLNNYRGSGIIYFSLIRSLEMFSHILEERGISHNIYHGKMNAEQRRRAQSHFMGEDSALMLATNAFGMGIDKPDIRFVVHAQLPGSLESYYQEIGRAGRDGREALCLLLFDQNDLAVQMEFIKWSNPGPVFFRNLYGLLKNEKEKTAALGLDFLREQLHYKQRNDFRLETALNLLDRYGVTEGEIEQGNLILVSTLPAALTEGERLERRLLHDQKKLFSLVEYFRSRRCRRIFISEYFGFFDQPPCRNCDICEGR